MNYKLLFQIELEKSKQLEDRLFIKDVKINNIQEEIKKLKSTIETQEHRIAVLNDKEPEVVYISRDSVYA